MVRVLARMRGYALANARHTRFGVLSLAGAALLGLAGAWVAVGRELRRFATGR